MGLQVTRIGSLVRGVGSQGFDDDSNGHKVYAATMTVVMAEKDQPVLRDFLGIGHKDESLGKHLQPSSGSIRRVSNAAVDEEGDGETPTKAFSGNAGLGDGHSTPGLSTPPLGTAFPTASEPGSDGWLRARAGGQLQNHGVKSAFYKPETDSRVGKKRESPGGRESLQERLQMSVEALENSRPSKVTRVEQKDDRRIKSRPSLTDELNLSMQLPRPPSKGVVMLQSNVFKPEVSPRTSSKQERARTPLNVGVSAPHRGSHSVQSLEKPPTQIVVENNLSMDSMGLPPLPAPPAADEGSRTGIKGSGLLAGLQQNAPSSSHIPSMSGGLAPAPRKPKLSGHSIVSDTNLVSRHQFPTPPSRQLTIFYGGQAHVFDDVPVEKANSIMMLAGSNGRSWSTAYSPRQTASIANSASEGSLSAFEREKTYGGNRGGAPTLTPEVKSLLRGIAQSGPARSGQVAPSANVLPVAAPVDNQLAVAERLTVNGSRKDSVEKRNLARPEDNAKEVRDNSSQDAD